MTVLLSAGERVPVDAVVLRGTSEIDTSLATGESLPRTVGAGDKLVAGTLNLNGALEIRAAAAAQDSFLAEMVRLMEAAEGARARYRRIADRASALYSPVVHLAALLTFLGWLQVSGDVHYALTTAIAVLIITCPCALGLAVPIVQVMAARRLFEEGIMLKDGSALERLAEADTILFDKTGTLTLGRPRLVNADDISADHLAIAAAMSSYSRHPLSTAIQAAAGQVSAKDMDAPAAEFPGLGLEAKSGSLTYRLGRPAWALSDNAPNQLLTAQFFPAMANCWQRSSLRTGCATARRWPPPSHSKRGCARRLCRAILQRRSLRSLALWELMTSPQKCCPARNLRK